MTSIAIIDYGRGNVRSVFNALDYIGVTATVTDDPAVIDNASHILLPGVGAFGDAVDALKARGLPEVLHRQAFDKGKPFLGVCVGMQVLASKSYEHGEHAGLGWLDAEVRRIDPGPDGLKVPHMGWNSVTPTRAHPLFDGIKTETLVFYFVHSFAVTTEDADKVLATSDYGKPFTATLAWDNIVTTQFHPEKSQDSGLEVLTNFTRWNP
ncbi:MAG: imidazole glycerol phosphate synthase subunit HisH [Rhodospirillaceae bacterium]|jgi:imidazole glycerol-phosphate synthase subunit HisH|nr:imidazole glycerol phosphate synthase subunit HisH [Rhodospirillaceae bacterium]MBT5564904.1 imidazole glycerol phosphate synthase subunit HisH [Rhodospirillaceae bacterium]MBT6090555.1 imidazole glycerol phosphate synthase subunit HisH [Rhodospirillaceae bacterium]MBT6960090.1 imidazole glycerol phosphate synthase subunit HisH [Rhodospirillaceae bacterium]MBT7450736.1 imidazole glycerol phosphate synthase subunit HisH [Rhodospirillaceae bacterium]